MKCCIYYKFYFAYLGMQIEPFSLSLTPSFFCDHGFQFLIKGKKEIIFTGRYTKNDK